MGDRPNINPEGQSPELVAAGKSHQEGEGSNPFAPKTKGGGFPGSQNKGEVPSRFRDMDMGPDSIPPPSSSGGGFPGSQSKDAIPARFRGYDDMGPDSVPPPSSSGGGFPGSQNKDKVPDRFRGYDDMGPESVPPSSSSGGIPEPKSNDVPDRFKGYNDDAPAASESKPEAKPKTPPLKLKKKPVLKGRAKAATGAKPWLQKKRRKKPANDAFSIEIAVPGGKPNGSSIEIAEGPKKPKPTAHEPEIEIAVGPKRTESKLQPKSEPESEPESEPSTTEPKIEIAEGPKETESNAEAKSEPTSESKPQPEPEAAAKQESTIFEIAEGPKKPEVEPLPQEPEPPKPEQQQPPKAKSEQPKPTPSDAGSIPEENTKSSPPDLSADPPIGGGGGFPGNKPSGADYYANMVANLDAESTPDFSSSSGGFPGSKATGADYYANMVANMDAESTPDFSSSSGGGGFPANKGGFPGAKVESSVPDRFADPPPEPIDISTIKNLRDVPKPWQKKKKKKRSVGKKGGTKKAARSGGPPKPWEKARKAAASSKPPTSQSAPEEQPKQPSSDNSVPDNAAVSSSSSSHSPQESVQPKVDSVEPPDVSSGPPAAQPEHPAALAFGGKPLESGNDALPPEQAPTGAQPDDDLPLPQLLVSKKINQRVAGYQKLEVMFTSASPDDGCFNEYAANLSKMVSESNPKCLKNGLNALKAFVDRAPNAASTVEELLPILMKKAFGNARAEMALEIALLYVEISPSSEVIVAEIAKGLKDRNKKIATSCVTFFTKALELYGPAVVDPTMAKDSLKMLFEINNPGVRTASQKLAVELYRWMGPSFFDYKEFGFRSAQVTALDAALKDVTPCQASPQKRRRADAPREKKKHGGEVEMEKKFDPNDFIKPVDIFKDLPNNWCDQLLKGKWSVKKQMLDELQDLMRKHNKLMTHPMLKDIVSALKTLLKDSNMNVVSYALRTIAPLAAGLKGEFTTHARRLCSLILEKQKEKKKIVQNHVFDSLVKFYENCFNLDQVMDDVTEALKDKVPKVREDTLTWLIHCVKYKEKQASLNKSVMGLCQAVIPLVEDGASPVRKNAMEFIGTLMGVTRHKGVRGAVKKLETTNKRAFTKVKGIASKCTPAAGAGGADVEDDEDSDDEKSEEPPKKAQAKTKRRPEKKSTGSKRKTASRSTSRKRPGTGSNRRTGSKRRPGTRSKSANKRAAQSRPKSSSSSVAEDAGGPPLSFAEASEIVEGIFQPSTLKRLEERKWKERVEALEDITTNVQEMGDEIDQYCDAVFYYLNKVPSWKESNFQASKRLWILVTELIKSCPSFSPKLMTLILSGLLNSLGDSKVQPTCIDALNTIGETLGPKVLVAEMFTKIEDKSVKAPKVIAKCFEWIASCVSDFGLASLDHEFLVSQIQHQFESSNLQVRDACKAVYVAIYKLTDGVLNERMFEGIKKVLVDELKKMFSRVPDDEKNIRPTRSIRGQGPPEAVSVDELIPRTDLKSEISGAILKDLGHKHWQTRDSALRKISTILDGCCERIGPSVGDLVHTLKKLIQDSNKNLARRTMEILTRIAKYMGPPVEKQAKFVMLPAMLALGDSKAHVVTAAENLIHVWVEQCGVGIVVKYAPKPLAVPACREIILKTLLDYHEDTVQLVELVSPVLACIQDKRSSVRSLAEKVLENVIHQVGYETVAREVNTFQKSARMQILPLIAPFKEDASPPPPASSSSSSRTSSRRRKDALSEEEKKMLAPRRVRSRSQSQSKRKKETAKRARVADPEESEDLDQTLIRTTNQKSSRLKKNRRYKHSFEEVRADEFADCQSKLSAVMETAFSKLAFSKDFQKQTKAIKVLADKLDDNEEGLISQLDLVNTWLSWRLSSGNTTLGMAVLTFYEKFTNALKARGFRMHEREADNIVPFLIEKALGQSKNIFRERGKLILHNICHLYDFEEMFIYFLDSVNSKNARVRAEVLVQIGFLVEEYGLSVNANKKALPIIAKMVNQSDSAVRKNALNLLAAVYEAGLGEAIWRFMSKKKMPPKQLSLIETRLKRCKVQRRKPKKASKPEEPPVPQKSEPPAASDQIPEPEVKASEPPESEPEVPLPDLEPRDLPSLQRAGLGALPSVFSLDLGSIGLAGTGQSLQKENAPKDTKRKYPGIVEDTLPNKMPKLPMLGLPSKRRAVDDIRLHFEYEKENIGNANPSKRLKMGLPGKQTSSISSNLASNVQTQPSYTTSIPFTSSSLTSTSFPHQTKEQFSTFSYSSFISSLSHSNEEERCTIVHNFFKHLQSTAFEESALLPYLNNIVSVLGQQIAHSLAPQNPSLHHFRTMKWAVHSLMQIFKNTNIAVKVTSSVVEEVSRELLLSLVSDHIRTNETAKSMVQALNQVTLKVLQNSDRTAVFFILLKFLKNQRTAYSPPPSRLGLYGNMFTSITVKCLMKLTIMLHRDHENLNVPHILRGVHEYFETHEQMVPNNEKAFRMVKTVLNKLLQLYGESIKRFTKDYDQNSFVVRYVQCNIGTQQPPPLHRTNTQIPMESKPQESRPQFSRVQSYSVGEQPSRSLHSYPGSSDTSMSTTTTTTTTSTPMANIRARFNRDSTSQAFINKPSGGIASHSANTQLSASALPFQPTKQPSSSTAYVNRGVSQKPSKEQDVVLKDIFKHLHVKSQTRDALKRLYEFKKQHPNVDTNSYLASSSEIFQTYIKRGLARLKDNDVTLSTKPSFGRMATVPAGFQSRQQQQHQPQRQSSVTLPSSSSSSRFSSQPQPQPMFHRAVSSAAVPATYRPSFPSSSQSSTQSVSSSTAAILPPGSPMDISSPYVPQTLERRQHDLDSIRMRMSEPSPIQMRQSRDPGAAALPSFASPGAAPSNTPLSGGRRLDFGEGPTSLPSPPPPVVIEGAPDPPPFSESSSRPPAEAARAPGALSTGSSALDRIRARMQKKFPQ